MYNKKIKSISVVLFAVIVIIFSIASLVGLIADKIAFPVIYICIGCQQLFNGLNFNDKNKPLKLSSILFGVLFIIFAIFIVIPRYYFK